MRNIKNNLLRIIWCVSIIIQFIVYITLNFILKDNNQMYNNTNYLLLFVLETINIIFGILLFREKETKIILVIYIIFIILTLFIPIYYNGSTYALTEANSHLMGLAFKERYLNLYGINIINFFK